MEAGDACQHTCPTSSSQMRTRPAPACAGAGMACSDVDEQPWGRFVRSDDADAGPNAPRLGTGPAEGPPPTTRIGVSSMDSSPVKARTAQVLRERLGIALLLAGPERRPEGPSVATLPSSVAAARSQRRRRRLRTWVSRRRWRASARWSGPPPSMVGAPPTRSSRRCRRRRQRHSRSSARSSRSGRPE